MSPDAPPSRRGTGTDGQIERDSRIGNQSTATLPHQSPTLRYLRGREKVLGRRIWLHREPTIAAALLVEELGPLGARAWLRGVAEEVGL